jgi:hypothetical protein
MLLLSCSDLFRKLYSTNGSAAFLTTASAYRSPALTRVLHYFLVFLQGNGRMVLQITPQPSPSICCPTLCSEFILQMFYTAVYFLSDDGPVRSERRRSLVFFLNYYGESNDSCVHLLVGITEIEL